MTAKPLMKDKGIINRYGYSFGGKRLKYVLQIRQKGLVHTIECARSALEQEDFMLMLGDELMVNPRHLEMIQHFEKKKLFGACSVVKVKDRELIKKTYSLIQSGDNRIFRLIEKT